MSRSRAVALMLTAIVAVTAGCGATYRPRASRRISQVDSLEYVRDGRHFELGSFGGGALDLVGGNDLAVQYARKYRRNLIAGSVFLAVAYATVLTQLIVLFPRAQHDQAYAVATATSTIGGLSLAITGAVLVSRSQGALRDAINIYNDSLEGPIDPRALEPPPPPPGGR